MISKEEMDYAYSQLEKLMGDDFKGEKVDVVEVAYLTGMVEGFRKANDYCVPEIEYAYLIMNRVNDRGYEKCMDR